MNKCFQLPFYGFLFCISFISALHANEKIHPNVIFILADDLGWADTTLYGHTNLYQTPNLKKLADRGLLLTRAYSASPLCSPTRSAILTGQSPARTGITTPSCHLPQVVLQATVPKQAAADQKAVMPTSVTRLKSEYRTMAESFKDAGFVTAHFGKWHLGPEPYSPKEHGFDFDLPHHAGPGPAGSYVAPWKFRDFDHDPAIPNEHIEDRMAKEAVAFMEKHRDQPFFLNYWMFSVHAPFDAKKSLIEKYQKLVKPDDRQKSPTYAAMVESMDDAVGAILDTLERLKIADRTVIIFTSDNGGNMYSEVDSTVPTSNFPLRGGKATMFEGGTRVPGIILWPGVTKPGTKSDMTVQSEDYYPTLLEGLNLKKQPGQIFDGQSLFMNLKGKPQDERSIFQYFPHNPSVPDWLPPSVSVHRKDWKLIRLFHAGENGHHRYQLYHLADDLSETRNLATQHPEIVEKLDQDISDFLKRTSAVTPVPNPAFKRELFRPELEGVAKRKSATKKKTDSKQTLNENDPALLGWKPRGCQARILGENLELSGVGASSFLGFAVGARHNGPIQVQMKIQSAMGPSHVDWLPKGIGDKPLTQNYEITTDGELTTVKIDLPSTGSIGILRIYLPMQNNAAKIDKIEIISQGGSKRNSYDFGSKN